jgi:hypothetical protein
MSDGTDERAGFAGAPSRPRAGRMARLLVLLLLLGLAVGAIWFIDRGAMMTNGKSGAATQAAVKTAG